MSVFGGDTIMWLTCPNPSLFCLPHYLKFLTLFVVFMGGWFGYEMRGLINLESVRFVGLHHITVPQYTVHKT